MAMTKEVRLSEEKEKDAGMQSEEALGTVIGTDVGTVAETAGASEEAVEAQEPETGLSDPFHVLEGMSDTGLKIGRESFRYGKDNRRCWSHFVASVLRGRSVRAGVDATDKGGYETLDLIFGEDAEVPLFVKKIVQKDDKGRVTYTGNQYYAVSQDPDDGMIYCAQVVAHEKSDRALLDMMITKNLMKLQSEGSAQQ